MVRLLIMIVLSFSLLIGCQVQSEKLSGNTPPDALIMIDGETYETVLGTYCWNGIGESTCVDTAGPVELLADHEPIKVKRGDLVTFMMDYEPLPNEFHVMQYSIDSEEEIKITNHQFQAPNEQGTYYYSYGVWWMDDVEERLSHGDAFYNFVIEVE